MNRKVKMTMAVTIPILASWYTFHSALSGNWDFGFFGKKFARGEAGAMAQARFLLNEYRSLSWDRDKIPKEHMLLADHAAQPNPDPRVRMRTSFAFGYFPTDDELAFYSDFYVKQKLVPDKGREARAIRSGFYIVGFKDGRVEKVPVDQGRLYWSDREGENIGMLVFPGMRNYHESYAFGEAKPKQLPKGPALPHQNSRSDN